MICLGMKLSIALFSAQPAHFLQMTSVAIKFGGGQSELRKRFQTPLSLLFPVFQYVYMRLQKVLNEYLW